MSTLLNPAELSEIAFFHPVSSKVWLMDATEQEKEHYRRFKACPWGCVKRLFPLPDGQLSTKLITINSFGSKNRLGMHDYLIFGYDNHACPPGVFRPTVSGYAAVGKSTSLLEIWRHKPYAVEQMLKDLVSVHYQICPEL